jgi:hypothetical protein
MKTKKINTVQVSDNFYEENENSKKLLLKKDINNREIFIYKLIDVQFTGQDLFYPNCLAFSQKNNTIYEIINETIMSLKEDKSETKLVEVIKTSSQFEDDVFYFNYNSDNYFHFIYDTLPYLISFLEIKNNKPNIKLLMNYPNSQTNHMYNFVLEFLEILGVKSDIIIIDKNVKYKNVYISDSYTHNGMSNTPPREEIYEFYKKILKECQITKTEDKYIYISRRSWKHNNFSNIGTNYTLRRKLINEDELVDILEKNGFKECFTETMGTLEKLQLFVNARIVIGPIGGGLCNVVFCNENTNLISINSPEFLKINKRFNYSYRNVNYIPFNDTYHVDKENFKKFMRVRDKINGVVGEIVNIYDKDIEVIYSENKIAGWNSNSNFKKVKIIKSNCEILDNGLNSEWCMDLNKFERLLKEILLDDLL